VVYLGPVLILLQIALGHISGVIATVNQYMVPGLAAVRLCLVLQVPGFISLAELIAAKDHTSITVTLVINYLAYFKIEHCLLAQLPHYLLYLS
jgi:hypothetical protein